MIKHVCDPNGGGAEALPLDDPRAQGRGGYCGKKENLVVVTGLSFPPMTNGDRVRTMCDGDLAKFFAKKVMDQVALIQLCDGRPMIGGTQLAAMKEAYALTFFSWLRSPAEEGK